MDPLGISDDGSEVLLRPEIRFGTYDVSFLSWKVGRRIRSQNVCGL